MDLAESNIVRILEQENHPDHYRASEFILVTKGKERGYSKRQELTGAGGGGIVVEFVPTDG